MDHDTLTLAAPDRGRALGMALLGSAAFGVAAGLGHGALATLHGAWASPALFVGGAALATPPLYLFCARSGARLSAEELVDHVTAVLGTTGTALLGLAAPVAFFSATLRSPSAFPLLLCASLAIGAVAVHALARRTLSHSVLNLALWAAFALALGGRLVAAIVPHLPLH